MAEALVLPGSLASFHNDLSEADKARALLHNMELRQGQLSGAEQEWLEAVLLDWALRSDQYDRKMNSLEAQVEILATRLAEAEESLQAVQPG